MKPVARVASPQQLVDDEELFALLAGDQVRVAHGHIDILVPHEVFQFNQADFARLRQPRCESVPQGMEGDGIEAVAVFRGKTKPLDGKAKGCRGLGEGLIGDGRWRPRPGL